MYALSLKHMKFIISLLLSVLVFFVIGMVVNLPPDASYFQLKWSFAFLVGLAAFSLCNIFIEMKAWEYWENIFLIVAFTLLSHWSMITQPFLYFDDFWSFLGSPEKLINVGVNLSRPFIGFLLLMFANTTYGETVYIRGFTTACCAMLFVLIFLWLICMKISKKHATILCVIGVSSTWILDATGYGAVLPILPALTLSVLGLFLFEKGYSAFENLNALQGTLLIASAFLSLLLAFCLYQIATPVIFTLLFVRGIMQQQPIKKYLKYLVFCAGWFLTSAGAYIMLNAYYLKAFQLSGSLSRAQIVITQEQILAKIYWFFTTVLTQSVWRAWASLIGNKFLHGNNLFYSVELTNSMFGTILLLLTSICLIATLYHVWKKTGNIAYPIILILFIPASFFPFLILPESTYLSYYAIPLILLILFVICCPIGFLLTILTKKITAPKFTAIMKPMVLVYFIFILINSLSYSHLGWIKYNQTTFEHIRNTLSVQITQSDNNRIHVLGKMVPYCNIEYSKMAVKQALLELGYDAVNYEITASENENYLMSMSGADGQKMLDLLNGTDQEIFNKFYVRSEYYGGYSMRPGMLEEDRLALLPELFIYTGIIPDIESCILIDLRFMTTEYVF